MVLPILLMVANLFGFRNGLDQGMEIVEKAALSRCQELENRGVDDKLILKVLLDFFKNNRQEKK